MRILHGHVPEVVRHLAPKAELPAEKHLTLAIGLPPANPAALDDFLRQAYDPASPLFHQFVSAAQFNDRYAPTPEQYEQVVDFARSNHLVVTARHSNRMVLDVSGAVADLERAFQIKLHFYSHPTEDRDFYAPDADPVVEAQLPILDISGLSDYIRPHPKSVRLTQVPPGARLASSSGSAPSGAYWGNDFRAAYLPGVTLSGSGQTLGLLQFDGFYSSDVEAYETAAGLPHVPLQTVLLDGYDGTPTAGSKSGNPEVSLDIEMAVSMAPGLSNIVVFEAGPNGLQNDLLSSMASRSEIKQLSCSWGWGGGPSGTTDNLFKQMAAQGQSFFSASGDSDAFPSGAVDDPNQPNAPSSCPYITVVGGTTLATSGPGGAWTSESVWNRGGGVGSSGGVSSYYALPPWQAGLNLNAAAGSTAYRNTPDVALVGENIYVEYGAGTNGVFGGTSCAAPLWAGLAALMNEQAARSGRSPIGFMNPVLYSLGKSSSYPQMFHDITAGDNTWASSPNLFHAVPGYDLCTGWGTPGGQNLIDAVAGPRDALEVTPALALLGAGAAGGPFSPGSAQFTVTNAGSATLNWSLINTSSWIEVDFASGTLAPGVDAVVKAALSAGADDLPEGNFEANLVFSNAATRVAQTVTCQVGIGQSIVQNGGFETGDFTGWNLVGQTIVNNSPTGPTVYNAVESNASGYQAAHSGNYGAFLGDTQLATLSQVLPTIPGQQYLLSFWLNNPASGSGQQFLLTWSSGSSSSNTLLALNNPPSFGWTNLQFLVTAKAASSTLAFGAQNPPGGFDLDDVSVKPLPAIGFNSVALGAGGFQLNWRSALGVLYQVQYSNDLWQNVWINLGSPTTGTGAVMSVTDPAATPANPRFYRLVASP